MKKRLLPFLLYFLPVTFFTVCYFLMVTSGEDIWQGAHSAPHLISDALAAFKHSARFADMYAWTIINFFDYTFTFGPDTIFRLFDVFLAFANFYLASYLVLRHPPRLRLKDALVFASLFLITFLTSSGATFYFGFSKAHNYLLILFFTFIFFLPFAKLLWRQSFRPFSNSVLNSCYFFLIAFFFAFSSNLTALIFLLALFFYCLIQKFRHHSLHLPKTLLLPSLAGISLALILIFVVGDGLSDYTSNSDYLIACDYLPFADFLAHPFLSLPRILKHNAFNFFRFFAPLVLFALPPLSLYLLNRHTTRRSSNSVNQSSTTSDSFLGRLRALLPHFSASDYRFFLAGSLFVFIHLICFSQIYYLTRLVLPAYLVAAILLVHFFRRLFHSLKSSSTPASSNATTSGSISPNTPTSPVLRYSKFYSYLCLCLISSLLIIRTYFALDYLALTVPLFEQIKTSPETTLCFDRQAIQSRDLPYLHLGQEAFLADWAIPQTIYNKTIYYCS